MKPQKWRNFSRRTKTRNGPNLWHNTGGQWSLIPNVVGSKNQFPFQDPNLKSAPISFPEQLSVSMLDELQEKPSILTDWDRSPHLLRDPLTDDAKPCKMDRSHLYKVPKHETGLLPKILARKNIFYFILSLGLTCPYIKNKKTVQPKVYSWNTKL